MFKRLFMALALFLEGKPEYFDFLLMSKGIDPEPRSPDRLTQMQRFQSAMQKKFGGDFSFDLRT